MDKFRTPFQQALIEVPQLYRTMRERLALDRTTAFNWRRGVTFPNKQNADRIIALFAEFGIGIDYNGIYRAEDAR